MTDKAEEREATEEAPKRGRGRPRNPVKPVASITHKEIEAKLQEQVMVYAKDLDVTTMTAGDWQNLRNIAALGMAAQAINKQLVAHATGESPLTPTEVKALSDAVKVIMAEERQQNAALGLDRRTRLSGEQSELEMYLPKLAKEGRQLLYEHCIAIICLECRKSEAQVDIKTGFLLYHFFEEDLDWNATFRCQRDGCGNLFTVDHTNWHDYRPLAVDEIQPDLSDKEKQEEADEE